MLQLVDESAGAHTSTSDFTSAGVAMADLSDRIADKQRAYLRQVMRETPFSTLTKIASAIESPPSTLTRFFNKKPGAPKSLKQITMERIAEQSGVPLPFADAPATAPKSGTRTRGVRFEGELYKPAAAASAIDRAVRALTNGAPAIDAWALRTRALENRGFLPGDIVLVDLGRVPAPGDNVCAQVYDRAGKPAEIVFRVYDPPYLLAASDDPLVRKPIHIDPEHVAIKGVLLPHRLRGEF